MNKALEQGMALHRQGRLELAQDYYLTALEDDFDDSQALYLLGTIFYQKRVFGVAAQLLRRAVQIKSDYYDAWLNLGICYKSVNKDIDAKICWEKALKFGKDRNDVDIADVYNNISSIYVNAGNPKPGIDYTQKAIELSPNHVDAHWNRSLLNLEQGNYKDGFGEYHWGFKTKNRLYRNYGERVVDWDGSKNRVVIVWGEQGIGDEILFSSMIPDLQKISKRVIFDCHPRLVNMFTHSFPGISIYGTRKDESINWIHNHPEAECKIAIGELGRYFRKELLDFPKHDGYLKSKPEKIQHYKDKLSKLGNRLKVGISWEGGYKKTRKDYRSIPLEKWQPILSQDADFISLQYTPEAYPAIADAEDRFGVKIHHWPSAVQAPDYNETAALISALDLVITVNTSAHHLAGALGKKCWTLTPVAKAWRYWSSDGKSIPWYPSVTQYQQEKLFDWKPVMSRVAKDLELEIVRNERSKIAIAGIDFDLCSTATATTSLSFNMGKVK